MADDGERNHYDEIVMFYILHALKKFFFFSEKLCTITMNTTLLMKISIPTSISSCFSFQSHRVFGQPHNVLPCQQLPRTATAE